MKTLYEQLKTDDFGDCYGFYDWFCRDESLPKKAEALKKKLRQIVFSPKFDINKTYVFFKNNCPMEGKLYDDFRICDNVGVLYTVTPSSGFSSKQGVSEVWGYENGFNGPLVTGMWKDVVKFFMGEQ